MRLLRFFALFLCLCPLAAFAQTAEVGGSVHDPSGAVIPKASVEFRNQDTGIRWQVTSNEEGIYHVSALDAGKYDATVQASGFKTLTRENIVFEVGDKAQIDFTMQVGQAQESVTVDGSGLAINTTDATVSSLIDQNFISNIPLNGRSIQSLILLAPGTVSGTPQYMTYSSQNDVNVNGMRQSDNPYMLDGLNESNAPQGWFGSAPSATVLGTTQSIITADAMEEFQMATSSYSAEFGGGPGAQISMKSKSGTNDYHGLAFEYLRNDVFDANNWFDDYSTPPIAKPAERQNDFGGTFGGPLSIPHLYSGKDRAFFFLAYEGLRLSQPQAASIIYVPSNGTFNTATYANPLYENLRANAPAPLQPILNAFPKPNCSTAQDNQCVDYGDGLSPFLFTGSIPGTIDAMSARLDFQISSSTRLFVRWNDVRSETSQSIAPWSGPVWDRARQFVAGIDSTLRPTLTNELRLQFDPHATHEYGTSTTFGGAQPASMAALQGSSDTNALYVFYLNFPSESINLYQYSFIMPMWPEEAKDAVTWAYRNHVFRFGADYYQRTGYYFPDGSFSPQTRYYFTSADSVLNNAINTGIYDQYIRNDVTAKSFAAFAQDEWRINQRIHASLGLRLDLNPAPTVTGGPDLTYSGNLNDPSSLTLAPEGTPFYPTVPDFGPRIGFAAVLDNRSGHETVLRAGGGLYYSTGQFLTGIASQGRSLGSSFNQTIGSSVGKPVSYPFPASIVDAPFPANPLVAPYVLQYKPARNYFPPSDVQWTLSLEQALGPAQHLTFSYVGSEGRHLQYFKQYSWSNPGYLFSSALLYENGPGSNYNSLQVQYRRSLLHGLQTLASYTWSHSIDSVSVGYASGGVLPPQRGNADTDVRNNFNAALSYDLPNQYQNRFVNQVLGYWGADLRLALRSAFPVQVYGATVVDPVTGDEYESTLNYSGANPYVHTAGIPGGRQYNPAVFSVPVAGQTGNSPRNFLRGFGMGDADLAIRRTFPLYEQLHLQFRAEAFNLLNHPNFGTVNSSCGTSTAGAVCTNPLMGQAENDIAEATNGSSLGAGYLGLSTLYQTGGPRSLQFALRLQF